jgi:hypothetical protein
MSHDLGKSCGAIKVAKAAAARGDRADAIIIWGCCRIPSETIPEENWQVNSGIGIQRNVSAINYWCELKDIVRGAGEHNKMYKTSGNKMNTQKMTKRIPQMPNKLYRVSRYNTAPFPTPSMH